MTLAGLKKLKDFIQRHPDARPWLENWVADAREAVWKSPQDVKNRYRTASFLPGNRIIFNVKGNAYRMEVNIAYKSGVAVIKRIGTHAEYDG